MKYKVVTFDKKQLDIETTDENEKVNTCLLNLAIKHGYNKGPMFLYHDGRILEGYHAIV